MTNVISNASIVMNNVAVSIVPNSFSYQGGDGEQDIRVQTSGGGNSSVVFSDNVETHVSMPKFKLFPTKENIALIATWKANKATNALQVVDNDNNFTLSFPTVALTNHTEIALGSDTDISLEFKGGRVI